ncbi:ABC transporter permease [Actinomyces culturomici]|uniref:ABC transporter permease n=1 Tax=Actinomyces culturomici TaxID=1926276 RepID=UPI000E202077|nr:ABC transporter permease [Actinomyces culturomici]
MEDNEYYGALIVPDGFTASQAAAKAGTGEALTLQVELDNAKSPVVANSLRSQIAQMFASKGVDVEVTVLHQGDSTSASTNPLSIMMSQQLGIIPTVIMSIVSALLIRNAARIRPGSSATEKAGTIGLQVCVAVFASAAIGLVVPALLHAVAGASVPYWTLFGFLWTGSFALMLCFLGAFNVATWLGALLAAATIPFGTATGILPYEALNSFWQHWVNPWAPQHYIGNGLRQILFMDAGACNPTITGLLWAGAIGLVLLCAAILIPSKARVAVDH